jgi:cytidyltransferase-like protein
MTTEHFVKPELGGFENKIVTYQEAATKIRENRERGLKVVLAQGVFDIVHVGHLEYLRRAKLACDLLFVGIENDLCVRSNKGDERPFNNLENRLEFLSQLQSVDFAFGFDDAPLYSDPASRGAYILRFRELNPNAIAVTTWDSNTNLKELQANEAGIELLYVDSAKRDSTTRLLRAIGYE